MSLSSQTSSVLEQVYNISVQEETVRSDISGLDQKIGQLQSLIDEAEKQLNSFTHRRNEVYKKDLLSIVRRDLSCENYPYAKCSQCSSESTYLSMEINNLIKE